MFSKSLIAMLSVFANAKQLFENGGGDDASLHCLQDTEFC